MFHALQFIGSKDVFLTKTDKGLLGLKSTLPRGSDNWKASKMTDSDIVL
jgi:hypothetical protein